MPFLTPGDLPDQGIEPVYPVSPTLAGEFFTAEPPGKPNQVSTTVILYMYIHTAAKSLQSYPTLCDTIDGSPPGSSIDGILQARILEWFAMPFSRGIFPAQGSNQVSLQADSLLSELPGKPPPCAATTHTLDCALSDILLWF